MNLSGRVESAGGHEDWAGAAGQAAACSLFNPDVEEELTADELRSCYNCRYRRWTRFSFTCMAVAGTAET